MTNFHTCNYNIISTSQASYSVLSGSGDVENRPFVNMFPPGTKPEGYSELATTGQHEGAGAIHVHINRGDLNSGSGGVLTPETDNPDPYWHNIYSGTDLWMRWWMRMDSGFTWHSPYWQANHVYVAGDWIVNSSGSKQAYQCVQGGTSGGTMPTATGDAVVDGSVIWDYIRAASGKFKACKMAWQEQQIPQGATPATSYAYEGGFSPGWHWQIGANGTAYEYQTFKWPWFSGACSTSGVPCGHWHEYIVRTTLQTFQVTGVAPNIIANVDGQLRWYVDGVERTSLDQQGPSYATVSRWSFAGMNGKSGFEDIPIVAGHNYHKFRIAESFMGWCYPQFGDKEVGGSYWIDQVSIDDVANSLIGLTPIGTPVLSVS